MSGHLPYKNSVRFTPMPRETIVVLDPELNTQWALKTFLENEDYNVIAVNTIENARKKFSEFEVSGLITEYWIDHSSTLETIRGFKKAFPEGYVMLLTNREIRESEYEEILNAGADDFFLKPFSVRKILLHLRKGLKQRQNLLQKKRLADELNRISPVKRYPG
jgi:DNA-binding response OmpR family regulator